MVLKLYMDFMSQPSRAVYIVFKLLGLRFEVVQIRFTKFEQFSEEFTKINPAQKVPVIQDQDFTLAESHAIMRYVIRKNNIITDLYPLQDIKQCAKIDEYLDFHHNNTILCKIWLKNQNFNVEKGLPVEVDIKVAKQMAIDVIKYIDKEYLSKNKYICGDKMTLADVSAFSELMQTLFGQYDLSQHKNVSRWMNELISNPIFREAHETMLKFVKRYNPNPKL